MRAVRCPSCGDAVEWASSPHRPFCSERCRLLDLDAWARERYRIAGDPVPTTDDGSEDA